MRTCRKKNRKSEGKKDKYRKYTNKKRGKKGGMVLHVRGKVGTIFLRAKEKRQRKKGEKTTVMKNE